MWQGIALLFAVFALGEGTHFRGGTFSYVPRNLSDLTNGEVKHTLRVIRTFSRANNNKMQPNKNAVLLRKIREESVGATHYGLSRGRSLREAFVQL